MQPLNKVAGIWLNDRQMVQFTWEPSDNNDRYIRVFGVVETETGLRIDSRCYADKDLRTSAGVDMFSIAVRVTNGTNGVSRRQFFLCSSDAQSFNQQELDELLKNKSATPYLSSVIIGHAQLQVWIKRRRAGIATAISISLRSSVDIANGILGYKYICGDKEICLPFPERVVGGRQKVRFGSMLIPTGNDIYVVTMDNRFSSNIDIKKGSIIGGLF